MIDGAGDVEAVKVGVVDPADEFLGNLYHLNAEEEPENVVIPGTPPSRSAGGRVE